MACARRIVPDRPVTHVHVIDSVELESLDEALDDISLSKATMRSLDITTSRLGPDVIVRVGTKLPELVRLSITDDSDFDVSDCVFARLSLLISFSPRCPDQPKAGWMASSFSNHFNLSVCTSHFPPPTLDLSTQSSHQCSLGWKQ